MKKITFLLAFALIAFIFNSKAQIVLSGTSYSQDFDNISSGYPTGWMVKLHATASTLGTDTILNTAKTKWNSTTKGVYNYASADGLTSASDSAAQANATDRALGIRQTGAVGDPGAAFTMQIENTTDRNTFSLSFKLQSLDAASPRTTTWKVQFATGANPTTFTDLTTTPATLTTGGTTWSNTDVTVSFGALLDNQAGPVWIRIVTLNASLGTGNRATTAIDDVNLTWTNGAATTVAAPTFNPGAGTYYNSVNVTLSCSTTGSEIRYTTNGNTPDENSTLYTTPIVVDNVGSTTIKAIGIKNGLTNSAVASATYVITTPTNCSNIAELKTKPADNSTIYALTNEVLMTFKQTNRNQKFIQDASGAILIDDQSGAITTSYNIGDGITGIVGKLTTYFGMFQFVPIQDPGAATTTGNTIPVLDVTIAEMLDTATFKAHQSKLIRINDAKFQDANGTLKFAINKKYRVNVGGNTDSTFKTSFYDVDYINTAIPQGTGTITGIAHLTYGRYQITARSSSDIDVHVGIDQNENQNIRIYPNPASSKIYVETDKNADLKITNLLGQVVYEQKGINGLFQVNSSTFNKGVYFVTLQFNNGEQVTRKISVN